MASRFTELVVDCHDPERLAAFWCAVLDFEVIDRTADKVEIGSWEPTVEDVRARQMPPTVVFIRVPEHKTVKNRLHLDLHPGGDRRDEESARLEALGSRVLRRVEEPSGSWIVMADPEGNEFCLH